MSMKEQNSIFDLFSEAIPDSFKKELQASEASKEKGKKKETNVAKTVGKTSGTSKATAPKSKPVAADIEVFLPVTVCYARIQQVFDVEDFDDLDLIRTPIKQESKGSSEAAPESDDSDSSVETTEKNSVIDESIKEVTTEEVPVRVHAEVIRKIMERSFPELSKERTKIDYDKEKSLLVPVVFTGSKGAFKASFDQVVCQSKSVEKSGRYLFLAENGVFRLSVSPYGIISVKLTPEEISSIGFENGAQGYLSLIPKIPSALISQVITFFKKVAKFTGAEAIANICYSGTEYYVDVPQQDVTFDSIPGFNATVDNVVLQLHSHPCYPAVFSHTDDEDEVRDGLYGVVSLSENSLMLRVSIAGVYRPIPTSQILEDSDWADAFHINYAFPESWLRQVNVL